MKLSLTMIGVAFLLSACGAQKLRELPEDIDGMDCTHLLLGWSVPIQLEN